MQQNQELERHRMRVRNWLLQYHYNVNPHEVPGKAWAMIAENAATKQACVISMDAARPTVIDFDLAIPISNYQRAFNDLPEDERRGFVFDLRFRLLQIGVGFDLPMQLPNLIAVQSNILASELSLQTLSDGLRQIGNATLAVVWSFQRALKTDEPPGGSSITTFDTIH